LLQTSFGGNDKTTFALPNLEGNAPMHTGQGNGLSMRVLGEVGGERSVTLATSELPAHNHIVIADQGLALSADPADNIYMRGNYDDGAGHAVAVHLYDTNTPDTHMAIESLDSAGKGKAHDNMMPSLGLNFCIAIQGIYPSHG